MKPEIQFRPMVAQDVIEFCSRVGYYGTSQFNGIVAYSDNVVMGMVGFDRWTATGVEMHWFITRPRCLLPLWNEALTYLRRHGKRKIVGNTPGDNVRALRMIFGRLGFVEKCRIKDGYDIGVDLVISEYEINEQEHTITAGHAAGNASEYSGHAERSEEPSRAGAAALGRSSGSTARWTNGSAA